MRKWMCVPMLTLCLLLSACSTEATETVDDLRGRYQEMTGCTMESTVICDQAGMEWEAVLRCDYVPGDESTVEVLSPESIAGVRAVFSDTDWHLEYEDMVLNAGPLSQEQISPAECLPRLMQALRDGWLLEENKEAWNEIPCLRLSVEQTGANGNDIISTVWLRQDDGTPLRGEIAMDGENILTAEFTRFTFYDTMTEMQESGEADVE